MYDYDGINPLPNSTIIASTTSPTKGIDFSNDLSSDVDRQKRLNRNSVSNCDNSSQLEENPDAGTSSSGKDIDDISNSERRDCAAFKQPKDDESFAMHTELAANACLAKKSFGMTEEENREFWNMLLPTEMGSGIVYYCHALRLWD